MKKLSAIILTLIFALTLCMSVAAAEPSRATVTGEGTVYAPADRFSISFSFESRGKDEGKVAEASQTLAASLKKELSSFGELTADGYYSFVSPDGVITVNRSYTLTSKRVTEVSALTEKLIRLGVNCICTPVYSLTDPTEYEQKALKLAVDDAKRRAVTVGISGEPSSLRDLGEETNFCRFSHTPEASGKVKVECRVILGYNKG